MARKDAGGSLAAKTAMLLNIDPTLCTGCRICEVYCSLSHEQEVNPALSRIHIHGDQKYFRSHIGSCYSGFASGMTGPNDNYIIFWKHGAKISINYESSITKTIFTIFSKFYTINTGLI